MSYSAVYVFIDYEDYIAAMVLEESQGSDFIIPDTTPLPYTSGDSLNVNTLTSGKILSPLMFRFLLFIDLLYIFTKKIK